MALHLHWLPPLMCKTTYCFDWLLFNQKFISESSPLQLDLIIPFQSYPMADPLNCHLELLQDRKWNGSLTCLKSLCSTNNDRMWSCTILYWVIKPQGNVLLWFKSRISDSAVCDWVKWILDKVLWFTTSILNSTRKVSSVTDFESYLRKTFDSRILLFQ